MSHVSTHLLHLILLTIDGILIGDDGDPPCGSVQPHRFALQSYAALRCPVLNCPGMFSDVLFCSSNSNHVVSRAIRSSSVWSADVLRTKNTMKHRLLLCTVLSCPVRCCPVRAVLSCCIMYCMYSAVLSYPLLHCLILFAHVPSSPVLSCRPLCGPAVIATPR